MQFYRVDPILGKIFTCKARDNEKMTFVVHLYYKISTTKTRLGHPLFGVNLKCINLHWANNIHAACMNVLESDIVLEVCQRFDCTDH